MNCGNVEYKMSKEMAKEILKRAKSKKPKQEVLVDYVNSHCGLLYHCTRVVLY